jgi:glycosyltransferase involved in cell wall biosynthesis
MEAPSATLAIVTVGRPSLVLDAVPRLRPEGVPAAVEVLVVDSGGERAVAEDALRRQWPNSRVIPFPLRNMVAQRNEAIRQARGEIVIFIDDDCFVQPGWWPEIVAPFAERGVGGVAGAIWMNPQPRLTSARGGYVDLLGRVVQVTHRGPGAPREVDWPVGANMAFRRQALLDVGGGGEIFWSYDEDADLGLKIRRAGWRIVYQPAAAVYHYCLLRPRRPPTKTTEFYHGRNRSMLLVRHYGRSPRLALYLLTAPLIGLCSATAQALGSVARAYGHWAAYVAGIARGVADGLRHPVRADRERFAAGKPYGPGDPSSGSAHTQA